MTLQIRLAPETEARLRERAAAAGVDIETFAREALEEKLRGGRSVDEILEPIRRDFGHLSDQELDARIERAIAEARGGPGEV